MTSRDVIADTMRNWEKHGWDDSALSMGTVTSILRLAGLLRSRAEDVLRPYGISFSRYELLTLLMFSRSGALPMKKASSRLHIPPASVTHTVTQLEKQGLVRRMRDPEDGRGILVGITDQGIALVSSATPALNEFFVSLGVSDAEQADMLALCTAFRRAIGDV
ncbi:MarR family winged helix-turn-helix transcriptional regulator [Corynebacterium epidermidicanis]|uniref:Transcriptional regulator n=1 Tax=Corynebacterium epidermidicanis TaxID=1050174 RepID=A0A0G3GUD4_9CORY|nr:MarR family transcriptional regulator [Corynebacterium epidermidicanis]AKK04115.1 transcriptional regulator [Corynebacterium epidermidicanis]